MYRMLCSWQNSLIRRSWWNGSNQFWTADTGTVASLTSSSRSWRSKLLTPRLRIFPFFCISSIAFQLSCHVPFGSPAENKRAQSITKCDNDKVRRVANLLSNGSKGIKVLTALGLKWLMYTTDWPSFHWKRLWPSKLKEKKRESITFTVRSETGNLKRFQATWNVFNLSQWQKWVHSISLLGLRPLTTLADK